jgi:hypothetical protein
MPAVANLVRNSCRALAFLALARRNRTGTAVRAGIPVCAWAGNLLCYNLNAPFMAGRGIRDHPEGFPNMLSSKKKLQIASAFVALFVFALGVGCSGFFVDPVLTSITVGPTATINQGATVQESAIGTYNDGSTKALGSGVQWSTSASTTASVNASGLVTGNSPGTATVTAAFQATSGTASITVNLGSVTALKISPTTANIATNGGTQTFTALATVTGNSNPVDVSSTATWTVSDTTNFTITQGDPVTITAGANATVGQQVTVTATYISSSTLNATAKLTVIQ